MAEKQDAAKIVDAMYDNDAFSQWMGIERIHVEEGACSLRMTIRDEMTNGFGLPSLFCGRRSYPPVTLLT